MYYSLTFYDDHGTRNTFDDWNLVPTERPSFQPPSYEPTMLEIPGRNGLLDVSESLTGFPIYGNRTGNWEFLIYDSPLPWYETYSRVMNYLHGRRKKVFMEEEDAYEYEGRFKVSKFETGKTYSTIGIDYDLQPYKLSKWSTIEPWLWDPFNFQTGITISDLYANLKVDTSQSTEEFQQIFNTSIVDMRDRQTIVGEMPVCPTFIIQSEDGTGLDLWVENDELGFSSQKHLDDGETRVPDFIFSMQRPDNNIRVAAKGKGAVSIKFHIGSL